MLVHTVLFSTLSTLALALSSSPTNDNPCAAPTEGNLIKATWIAPRTFPNCGFAGVGCGSAPGPNGKRKYYCAPFKATCCQQAPEPRARRSRIRRQETVDTAEEQAEADKQVQDVSKDREDDGDEDEDEDDDDEGDEPIFGKPDGKRSYCPDGYVSPNTSTNEQIRVHRRRQVVQAPPRCYGQHERAGEHEDRLVVGHFIDQQARLDRVVSRHVCDARHHGHPPGKAAHGAHAHAACEDRLDLCKHARRTQRSREAEKQRRRTDSLL